MHFKVLCSDWHDDIADPSLSPVSPRSPSCFVYRKEWASLGNMEKEEAMVEFIRLLNKCCNLFAPYVTSHKIEREEQERKRYGLCSCVCMWLSSCHNVMYVFVAMHYLDPSILSFTGKKKRSVRGRRRRRRSGRDRRRKDGGWRRRKGWEERKKKGDKQRKSGYGLSNRSMALCGAFFLFSTELH